MVKLYYIFRPDLSFKPEEDADWNDFRQVIEKEFKNTPKVNVYNFACSDGSETYSLATILMDTFKKDYSKFFPIKASNVDIEIISRASSGQVTCTKQDLNRMKTNLPEETMQKFSFYESDKPTPDFRYRYIFNAGEELQNAIKFKVADMEDSIDEIESINNLIFCRNFWPYLGKEKTTRVLSKLLEKLDSTSLIVVGKFDKTVPYFEPIFTQNEFVEIATNIYKKQMQITKNPQL